MIADREQRERDEQALRGLRELGYPIAGPEAPAADDPPAVIVERQKRLRGALTEIHSHRPAATATVAPDALPVTEEALDEWIAESPATRKGLHREVALGLAYLSRFAGGAR